MLFVTKRRSRQTKHHRELRETINLLTFHPCSGPPCLLADGRTYDETKNTVFMRTLMDSKQNKFYGEKTPSRYVF